MYAGSVATGDVVSDTADPEAPTRRPSASLPTSSGPGRSSRGVQQPLPRLGVVALIVGAVGVANIMIILVLERRSEIGLRRALGATKSQIRTQFLAGSILLAVIVGVVGVLAGAAATAVYASSKGWAVVVPVEAWKGGIASAILIGAIAGLLPGHSSVPDAAHRGTANGIRLRLRRWLRSASVRFPLSPAGLRVRGTRFSLRSRKSTPSLTRRGSSATAGKRWQTRSLPCAPEPLRWEAADTKAAQVTYGASGAPGAAKLKAQCTSGRTCVRCNLPTRARRGIRAMNSALS